MAHSLIKASSDGDRAESSDPRKQSLLSSCGLSTQSKGSEERAEELHYLKFRLLSIFLLSKVRKIIHCSVSFIKQFTMYFLRDYPYVTKCYMYLCTCEFKFYWEINNLSIILLSLYIKFLRNKLNYNFMSHIE